LHRERGTPSPFPREKGEGTILPPRRTPEKDMDLPPSDSKTRKPAVVLDLDGTILDRNLRESLKLYLLPSSRTGRIFSRAGEALKRLSRKAELLGVTARCFLASGNTRRWLQAQGLPPFPVFHAPFFLVREKARLLFKRRCLRRLKQEGYRLALGVGDRGSDLEAYLEEGLFPVLLVPKPGGSRHKVLEEKIRSLGLAEGKDFVLFSRKGEGDTLWQEAGAWIERKLEDAG